MKKTNKVLVGSMFVNIFLIIIKVVIGVIGHSKTLIAHAIHSLSDLITDIIAIFGNVLSGKPADNKHPYGHGRIEYLTSIVVGVIIVAIALLLIINSFSQDKNLPSNIVIVVSIITLIIKLTYARYMLKIGKIFQNNILIASATESTADALTSIIVVISVLLSKLTCYNTIFSYSDNICTIIIGFYIVYVGYKIISDNVVSIIGNVETDNTYLESLKQLILIDSEIITIKNINVLKYGSYYAADIEIILDENLTLKDMHTITAKIKKRLLSKKTKIKYVNIIVVEN